MIEMYISIMLILMVLALIHGVYITLITDWFFIYFLMLKQVKNCREKNVLFTVNLIVNFTAL